MIGSRSARGLTLVAVGVMLSCCRGDEPLDPAARAVAAFPAEFDGSYPVEAPPGRGVREYDLVAAPANVPLFDGRPLQVWAYNDRVPGPLLRVRLGERLRVRFTSSSVSLRRRRRSW